MGCDKSGNIVKLDISSSNYTGELPSSIGGFQELTSLDVSSNQIKGPLPPSMSQMKQLQSLDLHSNNIALSPTRRLELDASPQLKLSSFRGSFNYERHLVDIYIDPSFYIFANLTSLTYLDISDNGYVGQVPSMLCDLPLTNLILVQIQSQVSTYENKFNCIAKCLRDSKKLDIILPSNLATCIEPTNSPTISPTANDFTTKSAESNTPLSSGAISGIAIGGMFFVCFFCACFYYSILIRTRSMLPTFKSLDEKQQRNDESIVRASSVNIMNLRDIYQSSSSSTTSSENNKKNSNNDTKHEVDSVDADSIDSYFVQPLQNSSLSVWSDELTDFHKGNIKISKFNFQNSPDFNFADVYTSSSDEMNEENDDDNESIYSPDDSTQQFHDQLQVSITPYNKQESNDSIHVQDLYPDENDSEIISNISNDDLSSIQSKSSYDSSLIMTPNSPLQSTGRMPRRSSDSQQLRPQQQQFYTNIQRRRSSSINSSNTRNALSITSPSRNSNVSIQSANEIIETNDTNHNPKTLQHSTSAYSNGSTGSSRRRSSSKDLKKIPSERVKMEHTPSEVFQL